MKKILGTGLSGMLGSCITDTLHNRYQFIDMSYDTGIDIRNRDLLVTFLKEVGSDIVLHLAAKADVDACEDDWETERELLQNLGITSATELANPEIVSKLDWREWIKTNTAFSINVVGSLNLAYVCRLLGKKLMVISTDFVFDGEKAGIYTEEDEPHPINHYGRTKWWAEQVVRATIPDYVILRTAFPYATHHEVKKDFVRIIRERFEKKLPIKSVKDQIFTPTYSPDIAYAIDNLITHGVSDTVFHLVGSQQLSPYDAVVAIANQFGYDTKMIEPVRADDYYKNRAHRPRNLALNNEKIKKRGVTFSTFTEGLKKIK